MYGLKNVNVSYFQDQCITVFKLSILGWWDSSSWKRKRNMNEKESKHIAWMENVFKWFWDLHVSVKLLMAEIFDIDDCLENITIRITFTLLELNKMQHWMRTSSRSMFVPRWTWTPRRQRRTRQLLQHDCCWVQLPRRDSVAKRLEQCRCCTDSLPAAEHRRQCDSTRSH